MTKKIQNKIKPAYIVVAGVLSVAALYGLYRLLTKEKPIGDLGGNQKKQVSGFCKHKGFPLRYGSCGNEVKDLQRLLNRISKPPSSQLKVDGKFGKKTQLASKRELGTNSVSSSLFYQTRLAKAPDLSFTSNT